MGKSRQDPRAVASSMISGFTSLRSRRSPGPSPGRQRPPLRRDDRHRRVRRKYLAREGAILYDNPHALLLCPYDRTIALCARDIPSAPALDRCVAGWPNAVRTDGHAAQPRERADRLLQQAQHLPGPIADRLTTTAERLRHHADTHDSTCITPETAPCPPHQTNANASDRPWNASSTAHLSTATEP